MIADAENCVSESIGILSDSCILALLQKLLRHVQKELRRPEIHVIILILEVAIFHGTVQEVHEQAPQRRAIRRDAVSVHDLASAGQVGKLVGHSVDRVQDLVLEGVALQEVSEGEGFDELGEDGFGDTTFSA